MVKGGTQCCAFGCNKRKKRKGEPGAQRSDSEGSEDEESPVKKTLPRTFHSFPSDPARKARWLLNLQREAWSPSHHSRICSDHFCEQHIDRTGQRVELKTDAVPTRFKKFPKHLKQVTKESESPSAGVCSRSDAELPAVTEASDEEQAPNHAEERPADEPQPAETNSDHQYHIAQSPRRFKKQLEESREQITKLKKQLKASRQRALRLEKRVKALRTVVKQLRGRRQS